MPDLVQITSPSGVKFTVAKDAADAFSGFLTDLESKGYKLSQNESGGYANRNIAGTNTPSQHAFGHAIDVNSAENPRGANTSSNLPPDVGDIAASHGLIWGGNWSGATRDPMHFEYGGKPVKMASNDDLLDRMQRLAPVGQPQAAPGGATTGQPTAAPEAKAPSSDDLLARMNTMAPQEPVAAPAERFGPHAQDLGIPMPPLPAGAPGPPVAPPESTEPTWGGYFARGGMNALNTINAGMQAGVLTPEAQRTVEKVPLVGPVLGDASHLLGGAIAVPGAAYNALKGGIADYADKLVPPNRGGTIGRELGIMMDVSPAADMPGFRGPTDLRAGADYARTSVQNALDNRTVPLPADFRAQPFAPDAAARAAAGPTAGPAEPTGIAPPPGGTPGAPQPKPRLSVGPEPEPRSAGAAGTPASAIPDPTRAEALANLEKEVNQSAEDRAGPQQVDQTPYVAGIPTRPLASRVFTGQNALDEKVLRAKPELGARDELDAIDRDRNQGMVDLIKRDAGDNNTLTKAREYRAEAAPDEFGAFDGEHGVDATELLRLVDRAMNDPRASKSKSITAALQEVRDTLHDADGNLETLPSRLYGARNNLTDLLDRSKGVGDEAAKLRAATAILAKMVPNFDAVIDSGAPRYRLYMDEYAKRSQEVNQQEFLQKYTEGTAGNKITDGDGYLQWNRVQKLLNDIYTEQKRTGTSPAKSLTDDQIRNIINVRNELGAAKLRDRKASVRGSDSFQQFNREAEKGSGPFGTFLRGAANLGGQGAMLHLMGLDPTLNALGLIARGPYVQAAEAARKGKMETARAAKADARTQELLRQGPTNPLIQP
jgi:hypothetical protein